MALTDKQRRFVDEYLIDLNATQAAIRAGYSEKTAQEQSSRLLSNVMVQTSIQERMKDREKRTEITQDRVMADIETIKQHAMQKGYDAQGNEVMNNYPAALKASELQGKHLGMFKDKLELTGKDGGAIEHITTQVTPEQLAEAVKNGVREKF